MSLVKKPRHKKKPPLNFGHFANLFTICFWLMIYLVHILCNFNVFKIQSLGDTASEVEPALPIYPPSCHREEELTDRWGTWWSMKKIPNTVASQKKANTERTLIENIKCDVRLPAMACQTHSMLPREQPQLFSKSQCLPSIFLASILWKITNKHRSLERTTENSTSTSTSDQKIK